VFRLHRIYAPNPTLRPMFINRPIASDVTSKLPLTGRAHPNEMPEANPRGREGKAT